MMSGMMIKHAQTPMRPRMAYWISVMAIPPRSTVPPVMLALQAIVRLYVRMKPLMRHAYQVEFLTPKKVALHGLWLGPTDARRVVIWIHGLGSTMFSKLPIADELVDSDTAVLAFNNRGHDKVASLSRGAKRLIGGSAHEIFSECVDDIEGAIRVAKAQGARQVFLAGHSTGCQKSIFWAAKKGTGVTGIILLAPISDYAAEVKQTGRKKIEKGIRVATRMVQAGKKSEMVPTGSIDWYLMADAQRFISLYSGKSVEEIFTYWDPTRLPKTLRSVKLPILALLAERDEYRDRPAKKMEAWFAEHLKEGDRIVIVPKVGHSFKGAEKTTAQHMHKFMKDVSR